MQLKKKKKKLYLFFILTDLQISFYLLLIYVQMVTLFGHEAKYQLTFFS
jgi:hypothetical protein